MTSAARLLGLTSLLLIPLLTAPWVYASEPAPDAQGSENPDADAARQVTVTVAPGQELLVRHHQNWGRRCVADVAPEIKIVRPPKNGTVEVRPFDFVVKGNVQSNLVCVGKTLPGVGIYYLAAATEGADSFRYVVTLGGTSHVQTATRIETEVEISVK